jgi:hypothetical protein
MIFHHTDPTELTKHKSDTSQTRAKATLRSIRCMDVKIQQAKGSTRRKWLNERCDLVIKYIQQKLRGLFSI